MQVIHLGTTIQAVFGVLDDNGNVVSKQPVSAEVLVIAPDLFANAAMQLNQHRQSMAAKLASETTKPEKKEPEAEEATVVERNGECPQPCQQ